MRNSCKKIACLLITLYLTTLVFSQNAARPQTDNSVAAKIRRFAPTVLTADTSRLSPNDLQVLQKIITAAEHRVGLFLRQLYHGHEALLERVKADLVMLMPVSLHLFIINKAP